MASANMAKPVDASELTMAIAGLVGLTQQVD